MQDVKEGLRSSVQGEKREKVKKAKKEVLEKGVVCTPPMKRPGGLGPGLGLGGEVKVRPDVGQTQSGVDSKIGVRG